MTTAFPLALDTITKPQGALSGGTDQLNTSGVIHGAIHQAEIDAILALEAKVGINSSAVSSSIDYKLTNSASVNPGHKHKPTVVDVTGTSYTLSDADDGLILRFTNAGTITLNCPGTLLAFFSCTILQAGAGKVTPTATTGATVANAHSFTQTYGINAMAALLIDVNSGGSAAHYVFGGDCA